MSFKDDITMDEIMVPKVDTTKNAKKDTAIVTEKSEDVKGGKSPLQQLEESIMKVDLVATLQTDLNDPLTKYKNDEGVVDKFKIPQNLYIVAIIHEVIKTSKNINLGICVRHGVIYLFTGKFWQETEDESIKKILSRIAIKLGYYSPAGAKVSEFRDKLFKQFQSDGIEEALMPERSKMLINLNNGTLEIDEHNIILREHRREDFLTYCLDYDYDEKVACPIFDDYLQYVLPKAETRSVLQEYMGFVFTTDLKIEKCLVLLGGGANGKSVFFEVFSALLGKENMSFKGLGDLCLKGDKGNNHRAEVENKLVNYGSELNPRGADIEIYKAEVSGEPVTARRLYKDVYTYRFSTKLIFNANKMPTETEHTEGFFRRFMIVPFDVTIPEDKKDVELHKKIIDGELGGVLNWAIVGLKRLIHNKRFTPSDDIDKALEDFKKQSNSVLQFIDEYRLEPNEYEFVATSDIYNTYTEFCNSYGYHRFNQNNFSKELSKAGIKPTRKKVAGKTKRGFQVEFG